jgi:hypothetical protein
MGLWKITLLLLSFTALNNIAIWQCNNWYILLSGWRLGKIKLKILGNRSGFDKTFIVRG